MRRCFALVATAGVLLPGCALPVIEESAPPASTRPVPAAAQSDRALAAEVVTAANRVRRAEGMGALEVVQGMNVAALEHAQYLAGLRTLDHHSDLPNRSDPASRLNAVGVKWTRVGENLAQLSARLGIANTVVQMWMDSPGHRRNLLNGAFTITGVGVARDQRGDYYVVQMYATP